jgi:TRAP-type C4-dicarboxylate transport system permease small subunit
MGSFRLFGQNDHTYWEFVVDQREKTVLAAFGVIGGILSVLFLLFLLLFGSNYMNVLQGELSPESEIPAWMFNGLTMLYRDETPLTIRNYLQTGQTKGAA